jgi:opacity protein-like surface antigen
MENEMIKTAIALTAALAVGAFATQASAQSGIYVGAATAAQGDFVDNTQWGGTATVGYRFNRFLAVEALADVTAQTETQRAGQAVFANAVAAYPLGPVVPYVLAGVGYGFNGMADANGDTQTLWNAGVGVAYNLNANWQVDARYRRIEATNGDTTADRITLGLNYRC